MIMRMQTTALLSAEWQTLQNQHEQYEHKALTIKVTCLAISILGLATTISPVLICAFITLFWIQEGIFKTFQSRLSQRLLSVELLLRQTPTEPAHAMQLHSEWLAHRPSGLALIREYLINTCRPTVAFPYVPMLVIAAMAGMMV
jgi:hypothetical protein